jgi:hypothetical protein
MPPAAPSLRARLARQELKVLPESGREVGGLAVSNTFGDLRRGLTKKSAVDRQT